MKQLQNKTQVIQNHKKQTRRINYKEAGITLVALVVTIIVLLILAGVTMNLALNNNGVLERAQHASNSWANATADEQAMMGQIESDVNSLTAGISNLQTNDDSEELTKYFSTGPDVFYADSSYQKISGINIDNSKIEDVNTSFMWGVIKYGDNYYEVIIEENPISASVSLIDYDPADYPDNPQPIGPGGDIPVVIGGDSIEVGVEPTPFSFTFTINSITYTAMSDTYWADWLRSRR